MRSKGYFPTSANRLFSWYVYTHSILRWKTVLIYLVPGLQRVCAFIARLYKYSCLEVLRLCDRTHEYRNKYVAAFIVVLVFDEFQHLTEIEESDPSAVEHVQLALKNRLKVFCSQIYHSDYYKANSFKKVNRSKNNVLRLLAMHVNCVPGLSFCLPPYYRKEMPNAFPHCYPFTNLDLPACLLRRSDSSGYQYGNGQTNSCCCGWAFDSTPSGFLGLFDHSAESFARYFHSEPQKIRIEGVEIDFDARQAIEMVFGGSGTDNLSLWKKMLVFRGTLSDLLERLFLAIDGVTEKLEVEVETTIPEDRLDRMAGNCRPQLFTHILRWAVSEYHEFCDSIKKDDTDTEKTFEILHRFSLLESKRKDSKRDDFFWGVLVIWYSSVLAEGILPN